MAEPCGATKGRFVCDYPQGHEASDDPQFRDYHHHTLGATQSGWPVAAEWPTAFETIHHAFNIDGYARL